MCEKVYAVLHVVLSRVVFTTLLIAEHCTINKNVLIIQVIINSFPSLKTSHARLRTEVRNVAEPSWFLEQKT